MSNGRKHKTTIYFSHPEYNKHWMSINRTRALSGEPAIPHGEPLEIEVYEGASSRHQPLGIGYCQGCGEIMLVNDEQQKWCPACRAERKRKYVEKYAHKRHKHGSRSK